MEPSATNVGKVSLSTWNTFTIASFVILICVKDAPFKKERYWVIGLRVSFTSVNSNSSVQAVDTGVTADKSAVPTMILPMSNASQDTPTFTRACGRRGGNVDSAILICVLSVRRSLLLFLFRTLLRKIVHWPTSLYSLRFSMAILKCT